MENDMFKMNSFFVMYIGVFIFIVFIVMFTIFISVKSNKKKNSKLKERITNEDYTMIKNALRKVDGVDRLRKKNRNSFRIIIAIILILIITLIYLRLYLFILPSILFLLVFYTVINSVISSDYRKQFKTKVIPEVLHNYDNSIVYQYEKGVTETEYDMAKLDSYDNFSSNDLLYWKYENYNITMADVDTEVEKKDSDDDTYDETSFMGSYVYVDLKKETNLNMLITSINGNFFGKKINLDNEEFNKKFNVCSDNDVISYRVLTPDVLFNILDLANESSMYMDICLRNNMLFFRFCSGNMFEAYLRDEDKEILDIYSYIFLLDSIKKITKEIVKAIDELEV